MCLKDFITQFTLANRRHEKSLNIIHDILAFNSTLLLMVYLIYFRKTQKEVDIFCDLTENTPSDYTILIYHIPLRENVNFKEKIREMLEKKFDVQVTKVLKPFV